MRYIRLYFLALLMLCGGALTAFRPAATAADPIREVREVAAFNKVRLATSATVIVHQGSQREVVVEASPEDLARLETTVVDGRLLIRNRAEDDWKHLWKNMPRLGSVTIHVTMPTIQALAVSSSGTLKADSFQATGLALAVSGSGKLVVGQVQASKVRMAVAGSGHVMVGQLLADTLHSANSGSGSTSVAGKCPHYTLAISGSGHVRAAELSTETCQARISGSGGCRVNVSRMLDARISGSGAVVVTGAAQITSRTSGSGRVRRG